MTENAKDEVSFTHSSRNVKIVCSGSLERRPIVVHVSHANRNGGSSGQWLELGWISSNDSENMPVILLTIKLLLRRDVAGRFIDDEKVGVLERVATIKMVYKLGFEILKSPILSISVWE